MSTAQQSPSTTTTFIRNMQAGPTVFVNQAESIHIEFGGKGAVDGSDLQQVPRSVMDSPSFSKAIRKGVLVSISNEEAAHYLERQQQAQDDKLAVEAEDHERVLDTYENETVASMATGSDMAFGSNPPQDGNQWVQVDTEQIDDDGKPILAWRKVSFGTPERSASS